jgi:hypothetical protein
VNLRPATWFDRFLDCNGQSKKANRLNPSRVKRPGFLHSSLLLTSRFFELLLCPPRRAFSTHDGTRSIIGSEKSITCQFRRRFLLLRETVVHPW